MHVSDGDAIMMRSHGCSCSQDSWLKTVRTHGIPCSENFDFCNFMANPEDVRDWNIQARPACLIWQPPDHTCLIWQPSVAAAACCATATVDRHTFLIW